MITIEPATVRDVSWIAANLNDLDRAEVMCQVPRGEWGADVGAAIFSIVPEGWKWCAYHGGQPVAAFGFSPINVACWSVWAFGTDRMPRAVPAMTRHFLAQQDRLEAQGVRRLEARSLDHHKRAFAWITRTGAKRVAAIPQFGRDGETFILWEWTKDD